MQKEYIQQLIAKVGGPFRPNENPPRYIARIADEVGVGFRSMRAAYYGQSISRNRFCSNKFLTKLERAARNAHHREAALTFAKYYLSLWETTPEVHREEMDAAREFIGRINQCNERLLGMELQARSEDAQEE